MHDTEFCMLCSGSVEVSESYNREVHTEGNCSNPGVTLSKHVSIEQWHHRLIVVESCLYSSDENEHFCIHWKFVWSYPHAYQTSRLDYDKTPMKQQQYFQYADFRPIVHGNEKKKSRETLSYHHLSLMFFFYHPRPYIFNTGFKFCYLVGWFASIRSTIQLRVVRIEMIGHIMAAEYNAERDGVCTEDNGPSTFLDFGG